MMGRGAALFAVGVLATAWSAAALPPGFVDQPISGNWNQSVGITFAPDGRMFVWEKAGLVWTVENDVQSLDPLIDIREEVGDWRDYGLLGFAIDPDFYNNGYIYLLYVADFNHVAYFGTPSYDPGNNDQLHDTIARLTRYTCNSGDGFHSVDYNSRLVLIGETLNSGFPMCHQSHGIGSLAFGEDGTLLMTCGDAASYEEVDVGGCVSGSSCDCLPEGIITPKEDVGAYRSQLVDSLNGKVLRIDPATGDGLPSNPYYEPGDPDSARSRVWAMGLRNPFRMTVRPGTGNPNPAVGDPGSVYIGDVGWYSWEELNVAKTSGVNFGWPAYEGMEEMWGYYVEDVENLDAPNPLFGMGGCTQPYFHFNDLIIQDTLNAPSHPNPCNVGQQIPAAIPKYVHRRSPIDWSHWGNSRVAGYVGNNAAIYDLGGFGSPVDGPQFGGSSSTGGVWYTGTDFPVEYQGTYFHGEYSGQWIRNFVFDANDNAVEVRDFADEGTGAIVSLASHPTLGGLYYIAFDQSGCCTLRHISWVLNIPPTAVALSDLSYGPAPLTVQFTGSDSTDPDGDSGALTYAWDFGDGSPISPQADPRHVFPADDITATGTFVGMIFSLSPPEPLGGGNHNEEIMRDGDFPPTGNQESGRQYDTFHFGEQGNLDWIGYTFPQPRELTRLVFQEGIHFFDGGWFDALQVQARVGGDWTNVTGLTTTPAYPGDLDVSYETFDFSFDPVTADGIRIYGEPGGSADFISIGELRVEATPLNPPTEPTRYDVTLTVTDAIGGVSSDALAVHVNNSPPDVTITSPLNGSTYPPIGDTKVALTANFSDAEHDNGELVCTWQTILHHNEHLHPEPLDHNCTSVTFLSPHGSLGDVYFYEITLTVADPLGLSTTRTLFVYPESVGVIPTVSQWGLVVLTVLLVTGGTLVFRRRGAAVCDYDQRGS